jgi:hypothetical protein
MSRKRGAVQNQVAKVDCRPEEKGVRALATNESMASILRANRMTYLLTGLMLGLIFHFASSAIGSWFPHDDSLAARNSLLVSQHLDQLFRKIDESIAEDPNRFESFMSLLQVYYVYDRRFVEQNEGSNLATIESANAAQRLGVCAKVVGDLELSKTHFRTARNSLGDAMAGEPNSLVLYQNLMEVQATIAELEQASGNRDLSRHEFDSAFRLLQQCEMGATAETDDSLAPLYRTMITLAVQMNLGSEARRLADCFVSSTEKRLSRSPENALWREQANEARELRNQVHQRYQTPKS